MRHVLFFMCVTTKNYYTFPQDFLFFLLACLKKAIDCYCLI